MSAAPLDWSGYLETITIHVYLVQLYLNTLL